MSDDIEQTEYYRRAAQLVRWIQAAEDLPVRGQRALLRSLYLITRRHTLHPYEPELSPLFGLDPQRFVEELHLPDGGAIGRIKNIGPVMLDELRHAFPPLGSPTIPAFPPPAPVPPAGPAPHTDLAHALLMELWARLGPHQRERVLRMAAGFVIEYFRRNPQEPDPLDDRSFARDLERRLSEAQLARLPGRGADPL